MSQVRIQLLEANQGYLDCKEGTAFPLNFSIGDIRDISKRNGSYSNTVTIIGNANSNNLLNHYYDVNIEAGTFDVNTLQKCLVEQDGVVILDNMYLQLTGVKKIQKTGAYEQEVEYEVEIKNSAVDFFVKINNLELTDLDLSAFNHIYISSAVTSSFSHTWEDGYKYRVPYQQNSNAYQLKDFNPCVYNRVYWDLIFSNAGFSYVFEEASGNTIQFNKLIIPYNGDTPKPVEDRSSWVIASATTLPFSATNNSLITPTKTQMILDYEISDDSSYYNPVTGEYTVPSTVLNPDSYIFEFEVTYDLSIQNNNVDSIKINNVGFGNNPPYTKAYALKLLSNNDEVVGTQFPVPSSTILTPGQVLVLATNFEQTLTTNSSNVNSGSIIETYFNTWKDSNASYWASTVGFNQLRYVDITVNIKSIKMTIKPSLSNFLLGSNLTINSFIPKKVKQSDYIRSICQMYNLFIEPDVNDPTILVIKTRDKFYDDGVVVDWTHKLAKDFPQNVKFLPELSSKRIILSYKPDNDTVNSNYFAITNEVYGQVEYIFENEYVKNVERKELIFSPTPNGYTNFGANVPILLGSNPKTNIRILLDDGLYTCGPYTITQTGTTVTTTSQTTYPLLSHFSDAENPTFDINYAICDYYFYNPNSLTNNNLYNLHYRRTLSQINTGKLLTAYFHLNAYDIQKMRLNDKIRIDNSYWNINKLENYNANSNNLTMVELISVDDELELINLDTFEITAGNPTGNVYLPAPGDTELKGLGKIKNNTGNNVFEYSNIDASNGNVVFNGKYNQTSNLTYGFVQGDYNMIKAPGRVYVDGVGNIVNSPAYVIANGVEIEENLNNIFVFGRDNFTATTSDTTYVNRLSANLITGATSASTQVVGINSFGELVAVEANYFDSDSELSTFDGTVSQCADYNAGTPTGVAFNHTSNNVPVGTFKVTFTSVYRLGADTLSHTSKGVFRLYMDGSAISNPLYVSDIGTGTDTTYTYYTFITTTTLANHTFELRVACDFVGCGGDTTTFNILSTNWDIQQNGIATGQITPNWSDVLQEGNTSGPNNALMNSNQYLGSTNGGGQLALDYGGAADTVFLSTDSGAYGEGVLFMSPSITELSSYGGSIYSQALTSIELNANNEAGLLLNFASNSASMYATGTDAVANIGVGTDQNNQDIKVADNVTNPLGSGASDKKAIFVGTNNSTIDAGVVNSAIIGGLGNNLVGASNGSVILSSAGITITDSEYATSLSTTSNDFINSSQNSSIISADESVIDGGSFNTIISSSNALIDTASVRSAIIAASGTLSGTESSAIIACGDAAFVGTFDRTLYQEDSWRNGGIHTVQTTNATITTIYSFTPPSDGVYVIDANFTGIRPSNGNAIGAKAFATFKVIAGAVTQISTTTLDRKSDFLPTVTATVDTNGTIIRLRVTGQVAATIDWRMSLTITK